MKAILDKKAINIAYAAAGPKHGDMKRPILYHVAIGNGEIVATDGFMLARRTVMTEPEEGEVILIDAKSLLEAHKLLKGGQLIIETQGDGKSASLTSDAENKGALNISIAVNLYDGKFPDYKPVLPKTERLAYVSLQARLVAKILKATSADGGVVIKMNVRTPTSPVEFHIDEADVYLMPYYVPEDA